MTPPTIRCPGDITVVDQGQAGERVSFLVTALDDIDEAPSVSCRPRSNSLLLPGTAIVTCKATDTSGNQSSCEFTVQVRLPPPPR